MTFNPELSPVELQKKVRVHDEGLLALSAEHNKLKAEFEKLKNDIEKVAGIHQTVSKHENRLNALEEHPAQGKSITDKKKGF
jgi:superfamily II RNA helicase